MQGLGCITLLLVLLLPFVLAESLAEALARLAIPPGIAGPLLVAIFAGGLINLPVRRITREMPQPVAPLSVFGLWRGWPVPARARSETVIAINVGGCVIPVAIAAWETLRVASAGGWPLAALALAIAANVAACYATARAVPGVGIAMPGLVSPLVAVGVTWLLLAAPAFDAFRPPVAFAAGVAGPLIGADLLHLRHMERVAVGVLSIGGAGTFDGIVLSGMLAALLT